jgi:hypothetical protein
MLFYEKKIVKNVELLPGPGFKSGDFFDVKNKTANVRKK